LVPLPPSYGVSTFSPIQVVAISFGEVHQRKEEREREEEERERGN